MPVTLDFDGDIQKLTAKTQTVKTALVGIADSYDAIDEASKAAVNAGVDGQSKLAESTNKTNKAYKAQQSVIALLQNHLKQLETAQKGAQDPAAVKKYNTEIAKTQSLIGKLNKEYANSSDLAKDLADDLEKAFKLEISDALEKQDELAESILKLRDAQELYKAELSPEDVENYQAEIAKLAVEFNKLSSVTGVTAEKSNKLNSGLKNAEKGSKGLNKSFLSLLKNPIVLLIAAITAGLAALFNAFKRSNTGAEAMIKVNSVLEASMSKLTSVSSGLADGLISAFSDPKKAIKDFSTSVFNAVRNPRQTFNSLKESVIETTKEIQAQAKIFEDLALRQRQHRFEAVELTKTVEELNTAYQVQQALSDDNTKSFAAQEEAAKKARIANESRLKAELKLAQSALKILDEEIAIREANNENIIDLLEQQNAAYLKVSGTQRDITLNRINNERQLNQIQQDRLERDLDILIDGFDNQKGINEQRINNDKLTLQERQRIFAETVKLSDDSFNKQIETIQAATKETIDANSLIGESDAVVLNGKIRSLGLSEILEGRLLEIIRDRKSAVQDLAASESVLADKAVERLQLEAQSKTDGIEKELALEELRYNDLLNKLEIFGLDSTEATAQHELNKFAIRQKAVEQTADLNNLEGEERINFLAEQAQKEIDLLQKSLENDSANGLTENQLKQLALLRRIASEEQLKELKAFQNEELQTAQQHEINLLELQRDNFDSQKDFEEFKEGEILKIRLKFAEQQLALIEKVKGADSDAALALRATINSVKGSIDELGAAGADTKFSLSSLLGIDPDDPEGAKILEGIETAVSTTIDLLKQVTEARIEAAQQDIDASNERLDAIQAEIDEKESLLGREQDRDDQDFANNQNNIKRDIQLLQARAAAEKIERDKALKEKIKAQKAQAAIDTVTQASSLITASAQVFQSVAAIPVVGVALGATLVAAMIGSFIAAKSKVFQNISRQKAEKGMTGEVQGNRHTDGGERFGDHIEVEAGERFGVLSRKATKKYGGKYAALTEALNSGNQKSIYDAVDKFVGLRTNSKAVSDLEDKQTKVIRLKTEAKDDDSKQLKKSNELLNALVKQNTAKTKKVEYVEGRKIVTKGNTRYIIKTA